MHRASRMVSFSVAFLLSLVNITSMANADAKTHFDLPAEPLDKALRAVALKANLNISYEPSLVAGLRAPVLSGDYTVSGVLSALLQKTTLAAVSVDEKTIRVVEKKNLQPGAAATKWTPVSGATNAVRSNTDEPSLVGTEPRPKKLANDIHDTNENDGKDLQEITVTGTHIRGATASASPVEIYTRDDIDATGVNTIQQFLQTLPQNFNGGASENTIQGLTGGGQSNNPVNGSAPNLRGLGNNATLVLVNGHRVAPGSNDGSFVDVSMIPLTAIDRIEIVTDGASAIYGSDAVGGVVNIILRTHFDGAETRLQYGSVTTGSMHNYQAGQTVGKDWGTGSAVVSYQYFDQTPLSAGSRGYLQNVALPFSVLPEQVQQSLFANMSQQITKDWELHGDLAYSHRATDTVFTIGGLADGSQTQALPSQIDGYSASFGSTVKLPRQSELAVTAVYSESDTSQQTYQSPSLTPLLNITKTKSEIISVDANLDGVLASIPTGQIRYAIGAQFRKETFGNTYVYPSTENTFYPSRDVYGEYIEIHVPIVGTSAFTLGEPVLELTIADRNERYSDFGSTNNPQVGVIWTPSKSVALRATYGTSFKAPLLSQLNPVPFEVVIIPARYFNPAPGGTVDTLEEYGGNPGLKPEKATTWTFGADLKPEALPGFNAKFTYYDIVFKDEIAIAAGSICGCNLFVDAGFVGPAVLQRNPSMALVQQLVAGPGYVNFYDANASTVGAIFDSRSLNLSTVKTRGLDFHFGYKKSISRTEFDGGIDGTYIMQFDNQFTANSPATAFLNTEFNPTRYRLRGRSGITFGNITFGAFVNYVNGYTNNGVVPFEHVASWATVDATLGYQFLKQGTFTDGVSVALSVTNLTGRDPPYLANPFAYGINYDGANANALGRYISLRLQKKW